MDAERYIDRRENLTRKSRISGGECDATGDADNPLTAQNKKSHGGPGGN